jgi:CRP/FNR family transcriptional regulator, cyclic AMP receptor protein
MLTPEDLEFLSKVSIFGAIPEATLQQLASVARRVRYETPTLLFREGEPAHEMLLVLDGELEVRKRGRDGGDARIATLRPGDVAGEMALIDIQPRSAAVATLGAAAVAVWTHADVAALYTADPASYTIFIMNIAREISRRLRRVDGLLANLLLEVHDVWSQADATASVGSVRRGR